MSDKYTSAANGPELNLSELGGAYGKLKAEVEKRFPHMTYVYNPKIGDTPNGQMVIDALRLRPNTTLIPSDLAPMDKVISYPTPEMFRIR